jgi:Fe-S cluster biogenesis protein NfuA
MRVPETMAVFDGLEGRTSMADNTTNAPQTPATNTAPTNGTNGNGADDLKNRLEAFIDTDVRPFLQQDGGDIELIGVDDGIVKVHLQGACGTCPSSIMTLQFGVERRLKEVFPTEVKGLQLENPFMMGGGGAHAHGAGPHPSHY